MALVIGPNGRPTPVPDRVAEALVGDGGRGYAYASAPVPEAPAAEPTVPKAPARKSRAKSNPK